MSKSINNKNLYYIILFNLVYIRSVLKIKSNLNFCIFFYQFSIFFINQFNGFDWIGFRFEDSYLKSIRLQLWSTMVFIRI